MDAGHLTPFGGPDDIESCNFQNLPVFGFPETSQNLKSFRQLLFSLFHGAGKIWKPQKASTVRRPYLRILFPFGQIRNWINIKLFAVHWIQQRIPKIISTIFVYSIIMSLGLNLIECDSKFGVGFDEQLWNKWVLIPIVLADKNVITQELETLQV